jgi:flavin-dependent dehydrogenase
METVENLIVGAGPAGLRAAQVLAEAGREVLVVEKNERIGPKTCGGGLSVKAVRELRALGLPPDAGITSIAHASFRGEPAVELDSERARVVTLSRERLGTHQAQWARASGAEIRTGAPVTRLDLDTRTACVRGRRLRYRHIIGADGSGSMVRRALGLATPREFFAGEFNVPGRRDRALHVAFDSCMLGNGYFWVFPHETYVCIGAGGPKRRVRPSAIRPYVERRAGELGIELGDTPFEGAAVEVDHRGFHFPGNVHLVGDAAGTPSGLTAEGIYAALVTGEEVARRIVEPSFPMPKTRQWLRVKCSHDRLGRFWSRRLPLELSLAVLVWLCRRRASRRWLSGYFLEG